MGQPSETNPTPPQNTTVQKRHLISTKRRFILTTPLSSGVCSPRNQLQHRGTNGCAAIFRVIQHASRIFPNDTPRCGEVRLKTRKKCHFQHFSKCRGGCYCPGETDGGCNRRGTYTTHRVTVSVFLFQPPPFLDCFLPPLSVWIRSVDFGGRDYCPESNFRIVFHKFWNLL